MQRYRHTIYFVLCLVCSGLFFFNQGMAYSTNSDFGNSMYQWVRSFNDPLLDSTIIEALQNNYDINKTIARLTKAQGAVAKAKSGLKPLLNLRVGTVYLAGIESNDLNRWTDSASVDMSWDIDIWREGRFELGSQMTRLSASEADLSFIRRYIVAQTVKSWILAIETQLQLKLAERSLENYRKILKIVQLKYDQGVAQKQDISTAKAKLAKSEEAYFQLQGAHIEALRSIELLLGRYPEGKIVISEDLPLLPDLPGNLTVNNILENRDDILAAKYRSDAASLNLERAKKRNYPDLKLTSVLIKSSPELNTMAKDNKPFSASGIGVEMPIIDGGKGKADISISAAEKDEAVILYQQKNKEAFSEIETALMNEEILKKRKEYLEIVLKENIKSQELAKRQYESGTIDLLTVIYHIVKTDEAKAKSLHLKAAQLIQRADLYYSLGQQK